MQHTKNPFVKGLIHILLILWAAYSVLPFIMSIITSLQVTRDATAREPRFMPTVLVENNLLVALILATLIVGGFIIFWRLSNTSVGVREIVSLLLVAGIIAGGFLIGTGAVAERQTFEITWGNYSELWFNADPQTFIPLGIGLIVLIILLIIVAIGANRYAYARGYIYVGIAAVVLAAILLLPNLAPFAEFYDFFLNSIIVTAGTVIISISIGCLAGYGLARTQGIVGAILLFTALAFRALPRLAFILPYYFFAQMSGLYDTYLLLIVTFVAINQPFTIWMLRSFFMDIPRELEEAAMIDGCSRLSAFFRVILPITWPGIITTALFTLLLAYNEFLLANLLTSTILTLPVGISRFVSGEDVRLLPLANASAISITIPIVFVIIFFQRYLIKGLAGGAVKG